MVFVGAITGQGTPKLWKDIKAANPDITMFGPDGVNERNSGRRLPVRRRHGAYLTQLPVASGISRLAGAKPGMGGFRLLEANNNTQPPFYAAYGHAAGEVVLAGLTKAGHQWPFARGLRTLWARPRWMPSKWVPSHGFRSNGDPKGGVISKETT